MHSSLSRTLLAAEGYLELRLPWLAEAELGKIAGKDRARNEVLLLRCWIYRATGQWASLSQVARHLVVSAPHQAEHWLWAALAARNTESVEASKAILRRAKQYHPAEPLIDNHLAGYESLLGGLAEADERFKAALDACLEDNGIGQGEHLEGYLSDGLQRRP